MDPASVSETLAPCFVRRIPKQLWEEATTSAHSTSAAGEKPQNVLVKIFNGTIVEDQAFAVFYTGNQHRWNPIAVLLLELEEWCGRMNIRQALRSLTFTVLTSSFCQHLGSTPDQSFFSILRCAIVEG